MRWSRGESVVEEPPGGGLFAQPPGMLCRGHRFVGESCPVFSEIFFHDQQRNEPFPATVVELSCEVVRMVDDLLGLFGVRDVVIDLLLQVGVVVPHFDVVVAGAQASFHEPGFVARPGHHGDRIGGHDPPDVAGDVVAFERHDELRIEVGVERDLFCCTCFLGTVSAAGIRRVDAGIVPNVSMKRRRCSLLLTDPRKITRSAFSVKRNFVVQPDVQTTAVQIEQYGVVSFVGSYLPRSIFRALMIVG